jgi:hypothetical protein
MAILRMGKLPENYDPHEAEREDLAEMLRDDREEFWRSFLRFFR